MIIAIITVLNFDYLLYRLFCSSFTSFLKASRSISNEKLQSAFLQASKVSSTLDNPGNEDKLMLYALFKQVLLFISLLEQNLKRLNQVVFSFSILIIVLVISVKSV